MRRRWIRLTLGLMGGLLLAGCGSSPRGSVEPGATAAVSESEIPGRHSPDDLDPLTAQRFVDHVRLGRDVDVEGQVPPQLVARTFATGSPIYVSLEVTDAPAGSLIQVALVDSATTEQVWSDRKPVPAGRSYLSFKVDDRLPLGSYLARVTIGDETVARREFEVVEGHG